MHACPLQAMSSRQVSPTPWVSISPCGYAGWWHCLAQRACQIHQHLVNGINGRRNCIIASGVLSACARLAAGNVHCRFSGQGCFIWPTQHNAFSCMHFQDQSLGISLEVEISDLSCLKIWQLWAHWLPVSNQLGWEDAASLGGHVPSGYNDTNASSSACVMFTMDDKSVHHGVVTNSIPTLQMRLLR